MRKEYARLEQEIRGEDYRRMLENLKTMAPFMRRFHDWEEVITFMRDGTSDDPEKDEVLRPIFHMHKIDGEPRWRTVLLMIFWPGLESIHWRKKAWDPDLEERWQNVVWTFLQVVCRIDASRRPNRLVQKVINDTIHYLHDEYLRIWRIEKSEIAFRKEHKFGLAFGNEEGFEYAYVELREMQNLEMKRLRAHMEEGRISEADFLLIVGTRVYGKSIADYARETGINYQVAKKRRQRAEATILNHEKNAKPCPQKCGESPFSLYKEFKTSRGGDDEHDGRSQSPY